MNAKRHVVLLTMVGTLIGSSADLTAPTNREATLRLPKSEARKFSYIEEAPDASYQHASAKAYQDFRAMKYGVRIHWGLYSLLPHARESWTFLELPDAERQAYLESYRQWNPQAFSAEEWMQFFKRAGFSCFAITTKHHEGFSLWDTGTRVKRRPNFRIPNQPTVEDCDLAYSVMDTPFKRDIIKELCDAGRRYDLKINLYFSHSDWYDFNFRPFGRHPLQNTNSSGIQSLEERQKRPAVLFPDPTPEERALMMARHRQQLRELLCNYGKIDMLCLDIGFGADLWPQLRETIKDLRKLQPDVMFRNRGIGNYGDYYTPERVVPGEKEQGTLPWMVIYPLGRNFSWEGDAAHYKGAKWIVTNLVDSVAKGGNFMVGIGPDGTGRFHPTAVAQLEEVGAWLKVNGQAIFGTHERPSALWKEGDVRFTQSEDGTCVYAHLFQRPERRVALRTVKALAGSSITLLGHESALSWAPVADGIEINFPESAKTSLAYVIRIPTQVDGDRGTGH